MKIGENHPEMKFDRHERPESNAELKDLVASAQELLLHALKQKMLNGEFEVDLSEIETRLKKISYRFHDLDEKRGGEYVPTSGELRISSKFRTFDKTETRHILVHEMLHAASGKMFLLSEHPNFTALEQGKIGLMHLAPKSGMSRFHWLNEAVTEHLASEFTGNESKYYAASRRLFEWFTAQLDRSLFYRAYFEKYDSNNQNENFVHGARLWKALAQKFGAGFMGRLDDYVKKFGSAKALEELSNNVESFKVAA